MKYGIGALGGLYAQEDDNNPAWADIPASEMEEWELEHMLRQDEKENGFDTLPEIKDKEVQKLAIQAGTRELGQVCLRLVERLVRDTNTNRA